MPFARTTLPNVELSSVASLSADISNLLLTTPAVTPGIPAEIMSDANCDKVVPDNVTV